MTVSLLSELDRGARLVDTLFCPIPTTLGDALAQWRRLDPQQRAASYLVVDGDEPTQRHTLNAAQIEQYFRI